MEYNQYLQKLREAGFTRVERDDRLLDIFRNDTLEKGIELWEKWTATTVEIVKLQFPYSPKHVQELSFPRKDIEQLLYTNKTH